MALAFHRLDQAAFIGCRLEEGTELVLHWKRTMAAYYTAKVAQVRQEVVAQRSMNLGYLMCCALRMSLIRYPIFVYMIFYHNRGNSR